MTPWSNLVKVLPPPRSSLPPPSGPSACAAARLITCDSLTAVLRHRREQRQRGASPARHYSGRERAHIANSKGRVDGKFAHGCPCFEMPGLLMFAFHHLHSCRWHQVKLPSKLPSLNVYRVAFDALGPLAAFLLRGRNEKSRFSPIFTK